MCMDSSVANICAYSNYDIHISRKHILLAKHQCTMTSRKPGDGVTGKKTVRTQVMLQQQSYGDKLHSS